MDRRNKEGATLALTVTAVFFIIILGVGLFFVMQMIGGGREAQHATDAGNLNVAKQAMINPFITPGSYADSATGLTINESVEFAGLMGTNNQINLTNYNQLVGKAFLVACNASAEGTSSSYQSAQAVLDAVEGPGGVGQQLCIQLSSAGTTGNFFQNLAQSNSLRMLNWNHQNQITNDSNNYKVGFLRQNQGAPTNLTLINPGNVIPPGAIFSNTNNNVTGLNGVSTTSGNTSNSQGYFVGYTPISVTVAGNALTIYGVPVRPGLEPHLVSQAQFTAETNPPLASGGQSLLPANAFQSQSFAQEMHGANVFARSSAIVGALNAQAALSIPNGYIAINNFGTPIPTQYIPATNPLTMKLGGELMSGISVMTAQGGTIYFADSDVDMTTAINNLHPTGATDSNGNQVVGPPLPSNAPIQPSVPTGNDLDSLYKQIKGGTQPDDCNTTNDMINGIYPPVPNDPNCPSLVNALQNQLSQGGTQVAGQNVNGLMAIEYIKAEIIQQRGNFDTVGCGSIIGTPPCTGLKGYILSQISGTNNVQFGNASPTLDNLLQQVGDGTNGPLYGAIVQRMYEMMPSASPTDIAAVRQQVVSFEASNTYQYLYWQPSPTNAAGVLYPGAFVISASAPAVDGATPATAPDGPPLVAQSNGSFGPPVNGTDIVDGNGSPPGNGINVGDQLVDVAGDGGYPHPFDCEPNPNGVSNDNGAWIPSSGRGNLLGVLNFQNCATSGTQWCCPC